MINLAEIPQLARNVGRLAEIARTLAKYGLADGMARLDSAFVRRWTSGTEIARLSEFTPEARIRLVLTELGTAFIKFGQVLSTRRDVIGPALADELSQLQANVPGDPFSATKETIESELKRPLVELFPEFDPVPLASASIGQVHRATLHDGRQVVVKVQHPNIGRKAANDIAILTELAKLSEQFLPDLRPYRPVALVLEFQRVLMKELDFRRELRHLQMFRSQFTNDPAVRFPEPYPSFSTGRVLTMEYIDGVPFTNLEKVKAAGGNLEDLASRGAHVFLKMIFGHGLFHADPHPGNLLYLPPTEECPAGVIGLLDVGMVGRIDTRLRERIERGVGAAVRKDAAALTEQVILIGDAPRQLDEQALEVEIADQLAFYWGMPLEQFQLGTALNDLTEAVRRYQVMLPPPLALLLRVLIMLEGTGRLLSPKFNLVELLEPYKKGLFLKRLSPKRMWRKTMLALQDWDDLMRGLPRQLAVILRMMQKQEMGVQLLHKHLEPSVNRLVFGMMVSALFVGSALLWAYRAPPLLYDVSIFGVFGTIWAGILGLRLFHAIQRSGRLEERE